jgi:hypothetical protein
MIDKVLVHISTPATRQDDDIYRSLADAYLEFEPQRRHGKEPERALNTRMESTNSRVEKYVAPTESSVLSTSRESYGSFPSYISSGGPAQSGTQNAGEESVPTSSRLARLDRIHKAWKEKTTPKSSFINEDGPLSRKSHIPDDNNTTFIEDTQLGAEALQSQLPDSYSTTDEDTSEDEAETAKAPPLASSLVTTESTTTRNTFTTIASTQVVSKPALRNISANQKLPEAPGPLRATIQPPLKKIKTNEQPFETYDFSKMSTDAFPPAPKISTERPGKLPSQVTKHLAALKTQNPKRFRLSRRYGTPRYDDRGHWSIDSSKWPLATQKEFWDSIHEHVSNGRLGWGVTLYRDATAPTTLGQVRLYCWAEIVEHTWLLMWLCSKGRIAGAGSKWVDADGKVIFEVA